MLASQPRWRINVILQTLIADDDLRFLKVHTHRAGAELLFMGSVFDGAAKLPAQ